MPTPYYPTYYNNTTSSTTSNGLYLNTGWYPDNYRYGPTWTTTNTTTTWANDVVWENWVNAAPNMTGTYVPWVYPAPAVDPAVEKRRQQRQLASVRARALLEDFLTDEQKAELAEYGRFHVVGSRGRLYRIRAQGQAGNVELLRPDGALQARLCAHPRNGLPDADAWLAQMLELRHDEDNFLRVANLHGGVLPNDLARAA